ncbi:MAG: glycosyltransferase family 2 protein, partial [Gammaproteobacteria bacterium]|nr:glycosyltransferase family 2 protein [Gammaproteobacteria bacterium]
MHDCKVSVIIPVYNGERFLRQCLDSVIRQTLSPIEIILINDVSTDGTQVIIDEYQVGDDRLNVIQLEKNVGVSAARNAGLDEATGEYVIFLDADDYWDSDGLLQQLYDRAVYEQADFISFGFCCVDEAGEQTASYVEVPAVIDLQQRDNWQIKYNVWAKLISRELLEAHRIRFVPSLIMGEDALFSIALYCNAKKLVTVDDAAYCYRLNPMGANMSQWNSAKLMDTVRWFEMAVPLIRGSALYVHRPDVLQSVMTERLKMLFKKLGPMVLELLSDQQQRDFFALWKHCFEQYDRSYFDERFQSDPAIDLYRQLLALLKKNDLAGLLTFFSSESNRLNTADNLQVVTLAQQQAVQLGQDLLQVNKAHIRCDFGSGVIITLPMEKAHQLARQLIANQN